MSGVFGASSGFCPDCGSIFPQLKVSGDVSCYNCKKDFPPNVFGNMDVEYTIFFNSYSAKVKSENPANEGFEGPLVDRKCSKCGNDKMSYATAQLRSADEGQTVFFTCIKCNNKETENS